MLTFLFVIVPLLLLIMPFLRRQRLWWLGYILLVGGLLTMNEVHQHVVRFTPDNLFEIMAEMMVGAWEFAFCAGLAIRCSFGLLRRAVRTRKDSVAKMSLLVLLATLIPFFIFFFVGEVIPSRQSQWMIGPDLLRFTQAFAWYFVLFLAITSIGVIAHPIICRQARQTN